jgi:signal transduction histidine kinase
VGIDQQDWGKLFHKFSRIDNPRSIAVGGNGLGLYLAKRIMKAHGGDIEVDSHLQDGSTFIIRLPRKRQKAKI